MFVRMLQILGSFEKVLQVSKRLCCLDRFNYGFVGAKGAETGTGKSRQLS